MKLTPRALMKSKIINRLPKVRKTKACLYTKRENIRSSDRKS